MVDGMHLVLIGNPIITIPDHPRIHHLGFVSDQDKFDALSAAELLIMPSYLESLSMVALEAWALGKPVLANGKCDVLRGQCVRSNGGLYYDNFDEFLETLRAIDMGPALAAALGRNGREYFQTHYTWPIIERKYLDMLDRLGRERVTPRGEPAPGWFARRRKTLPPAQEVVASLPTGPVIESKPEEPRRDFAVPPRRDEPPTERPTAMPDRSQRPPASPPYRVDRGRPHARPQRPQPSRAPHGGSQPAGGRPQQRPARVEGRGPRRRRRGGPRKPN
jgi:hypothetical protein